MRETFLNNNTEGNLDEAGRQALASRTEDLEFYQNFDCEDEVDFLNRLKDLVEDGEIDEVEEVEKATDQFKDLPPFNEYGLCFDYVEFDDKTEKDYFRYQFSWGGPSEELRFYEDGMVEFVYLDWFCGVGYDVSSEDWAEWLADYFESCEMLDFEGKREEYNYELAMINSGQ